MDSTKVTILGGLFIVLGGIGWEVIRSKAEMDEYQAKNAQTARTVALESYQRCASASGTPDLDHCEVTAVQLAQSRGLERRAASQAIQDLRNPQQAGAAALTSQ